MTDVTLYEAVLTSANLTSDRVNQLASDVDTADPTTQFNATFINIFESIETIEAWANQKILEAQEEAELAVMTNFLAELKLVFDKYTAKIEVDSHSGYGESFGDSGVFIKLTATFEGVSSTKEINKSMIVGEDLI